MSARFSLGIDLGTSNSAVAVEDFETDRAEIVEITQLVGANRIGEKTTLPSALYIPHPEEFPEGALRVPWQTEAGGPIVGHFARDLVLWHASTTFWAISRPHDNPRYTAFKSGTREITGPMCKKSARLWSLV
jgi:molecular chaperone DnaK (HSP70)